MEDKIHIVHVIYRFDTGGLENGIVNIINGLDANLYTHSIVTLNGHSEKFAARLNRPVKIYCLDKKPGKDLHVFIRAYKLFRQLQPDIVHTRNFATIELQLSAFLASVPYRIHGEHGWDIQDPKGDVKKYQVMRKLLSLIIHKFVPLSQDLERYLTTRVGIAAKKINRICNGVNIERFKTVTPTKGTGFEWASDEAFIIGAVGRLEKIKDHFNLIKAYGLTTQTDKSSYQNSRLVIAGEGSQRAELEKLIHNEKLENNVVLLGDRSDIPQIMKHFNLFVLPSKAEGISNTILEAMACDLPVVATNVGGNPDLVDDNVTGKIVPSEDPLSLSNAMLNYLQDKALAKQHGIAGGQRVKTNFSIEAMLQNYDDLYQNRQKNA